MTVWPFGVINDVKPTAKVTVIFSVINKVTANSNNPVIFWGIKLGQTDHKSHRDL